MVQNIKARNIIEFYVIEYSKYFKCQITAKNENFEFLDQINPTWVVLIEKEKKKRKITITFYILELV